VQVFEQDRLQAIRKDAQDRAVLDLLRLVASRARVETLTLRAGGVRLDMVRPLTRQDVRRLMRRMPVSVQFQTHGQCRVEVEPEEETGGQPLVVAAQVLECLS